MFKPLAILAAIVCVFASVAAADSVTVSSSIPDGSTVFGCPYWSVSVNSAAVASVHFLQNGVPISQDLANPAIATQPTTPGGSTYQIPPAGYIGKGRLVPDASSHVVLSAQAFDSSGNPLGEVSSRVLYKSGNKNCAKW